MTASTDASPVQADNLQTVPLRHPWRLVAAIAIGLVAIQIVHILVTNERFQWDVVTEYLFSPRILEGLVRTILLTIGAMIIGILGGIIVAVMRLSENRLLSGVAFVYIWFFRGTPVLVQLIFWYNLSALFPSIGIGLPFMEPIYDLDANRLITVYVAALLGLGLNEAAYMSEIVRSGLNSVDSGQSEAASALGFTKGQTFRRIIMPQAMRVIIPPTGNQVIGMLKVTALVSVIALPDLLYSAQLIYNRNFNPIPLLIVASLWYLFMTSLLSVAQFYIERHYNRGVKAGNGGAGVAPATSAATQPAVYQAPDLGSEDEK